MRQFNIAGPTVAADHYCLDPLQRINLEEILKLIGEKRYFVLHAPRQTGKTTCLLALMRYLNSQGRYRAVYANVEGAQTARNNVESGMRAIVGEIAEAIRRHTGDHQLSHEWPELFARFGPQGALKAVLERWTESDPSHPTVLMLDEIDDRVRNRKSFAFET